FGDFVVRKPLLRRTDPKARTRRLEHVSSYNPSSLLVLPDRAESALLACHSQDTLASLTPWPHLTRWPHRSRDTSAAGLSSLRCSKRAWRSRRRPFRERGPSDQNRVAPHQTRHVLSRNAFVPMP